MIDTARTRLPGPAAIVLLLFAALLSMPAHAQSPAQVATTWGLTGTWAADCSKPPSREGVHLSYVVRDGRLFYEQNYGEGRSSNEVASARLRADGNIEIVMMFTSMSPPQTRLNVNTKRADGRFRTLESKDVNSGEYSIRDGLFMHNKQPSRWLMHCSRSAS